MNVNVIKLTLLFAAMAHIECGKCPPEEFRDMIYPCYCNQDMDEIMCYSARDFNLRQVFAYLSQTIDWKDNAFKKLIINSPELTQLEETTFFEITFQEIHIMNAQKLVRIHSNAFGKTRTSVKKLIIDGSATLSSTTADYNLFDALSSLNNINTLEVNGGEIIGLPNYAFRPLLGNQWNLTNIMLNGNIQRIGNYAFHDPSYWIRKISLGKNINFISSHAFDMRSNSHQRLTIDLSNNQLTTDSLEAGVFLNSKRPLYVNLTNNKLTHLDEFIFEPFLDMTIMNQVNVEGNLLVCDCRMKWLVKNSRNYEKQVVNAICTDNRTLWSYTMEEINECKITDVIV